MYSLFIILSLGYVTAYTGVAYAGLSGVYAPLSKPSVLFVFCHAQGLGSCPVAGIWPAQADGSLLNGGLILLCSIVVLTSTQALPTDGANCRVCIWALFTVK